MSNSQDVDNANKEEQRTGKTPGETFIGRRGGAQDGGAQADDAKDGAAKAPDAPKEAKKTKESQPGKAKESRGSKDSRDSRDSNESKSKQSKEPKKPLTRRLKIILGAVIALTVGMSLVFFLIIRPAGQKKALQIYDAALDILPKFVTGVETAQSMPDLVWLGDLQTQGKRPTLLSQGAEMFFAGHFDQALAGFQKAGEGLEPDPRLLSLQASTHLRLLNYGQAKSLYTQALSLEPVESGEKDLLEASNRLGLSLCLFHEPNPQSALEEASKAHDIYLKVLGATDPLRLSALNAMTAALMALGRSALAGDLLMEAVNEALEAGVKKDHPVIRDSLSILALSYEAQGRLTELAPFLAGAQTLQLSHPETQAETHPATQAELAENHQDDAEAPSQRAAETDAETGQKLNAEINSQTSPPQSSSLELSAQSLPAPNLQSPEPAQPSSPSERKRPSVDLLEGARLLEELSQLVPNSFVARDLATLLIMETTSDPLCRSPFPEDIHNSLYDWCFHLANAHSRLGQSAAAQTILENLFSQEYSSADPSLAELDRRMSVFEMSASSKSKESDLGAAEAVLRKAIEINQANLTSDPMDSTYAIVLALNLTDNLISQNRPLIEAEMELVAAITRLKSALNKKELSEHPLIGVLYLRLAIILKTMDRTKDSRAYFDLADRSLKAAIKASPNLAERLNELSSTLAKARSLKKDEAKDLNLTRYYTLASLPEAASPNDAGQGSPLKTPSSPEGMRLELAALKFMGRTQEFEPMIDRALLWAVEEYGAFSPAHRRYQSLKLKYFEESGDAKALLSALDELITSTGFKNKQEELAIKSSAMRYKARVLVDSGDRRNALLTLQEAGNLLSGHEQFTDRVTEIEAEINNIKNTQ
ncbi:MAG: hypothetical protein LBT62_08890 [Deltaproteobacteria bacterium]|jgi:hypothetical protein|nr:hypothetical protein [Deltaproteobacteria bacterium]